MGRNKTETQTPAPAPALIESKFDELTESANELVALQRSNEEAKADAEKEEVLSLGIDLGVIQGMDFVATVATSVQLSVYEKVKKSKGWRLLRGGDGRHFQSLDEFCQEKLGLSYRRLREIAANRSMIGQEAFEQAERLGFRQMDYNSIKSLAAPDQELIRQAVADGSTKEEVLGVLHDLVARHASEKKKLTTRVKDLEGNVTAAEEVAQSKDEKINELTRKVVKFNVELDLPEAFVEARAAATAAVNMILTQLQKLEDLRDQAMNRMRPADEHGQAVHMGELQSLGMVMFGGYETINTKLKATETVFNDTLEQLLAD